MDKKHTNVQPNLQGIRLWNQGDILGAEKSFLASIEQNPENDSGYGFLTGFYMMWTRLFSLEHNRHSALFHLKAALDSGFDNDDIILKDPKLEYIRDTPEFWQIVRWDSEKMKKTPETILLFS
jgi:hypothetical protein